MALPILAILGAIKGMAGAAAGGVAGGLSKLGGAFAGPMKAQMADVKALAGKMKSGASQGEIREAWDKLQGEKKGGGGKGAESAMSQAKPFAPGPVAMGRRRLQRRPGGVRSPFMRA